MENGHPLIETRRLTPQGRLTKRPVAGYALVVCSRKRIDGEIGAIDED